MSNKQYAAYLLYRKALRAGDLTREPCQFQYEDGRVCGKTPADGHHEDYDKPLDVRWLCRLHHVNLHRERVA